MYVCTCVCMCVCVCVYVYLCPEHMRTDSYLSKIDQCDSYVKPQF